MKIGQLTRRAARVETIDRLCDICGQTTHRRGLWDDTEVEIQAAAGSNYGDDGDDRTFWSIDCCIECFQSKVRPAIEALGVTFRERESRNRFDHDKIVEGEREG